jgi:hypothetical protein
MLLLIESVDDLVGRFCMIRLNLGLIGGREGERIGLMGGLRWRGGREVVKRRKEGVGRDGMSGMMQLGGGGYGLYDFVLFELVCE